MLVGILLAIVMTAAIIPLIVPAIRRHGAKGWPIVPAQFFSGELVPAGHNLNQARILYSYQMDGYQSGEYLQICGSEAATQEFIDKMKVRPLLVRYDPKDPSRSELLLDDIE